MESCYQSEAPVTMDSTQYNLTLNSRRYEPSIFDKCPNGCCDSIPAWVEVADDIGLNKYKKRSEFRRNFEELKTNSERVR